MHPALANRAYRPPAFGSACGQGKASARCPGPKAPVGLKPPVLQASRADSAGPDGARNEPSRCVQSAWLRAHVARQAPASPPLFAAGPPASSSRASKITRARRALLAGAAAAVLLLGGGTGSPARAAEGEGGLAKYEPMDALKGKDYGKPRMKYNDYTTTPSGLQFQDIKVGSGDEPQPGDTVVVDWDGYTIGYYGRPFEARNKPKGSSFAADKDFFRFVLGEGKVIPAFEEAVASMKPGGIRRIIVPVELGYPENDWRKLGPKPSTFAGDRALDFVLANRGMIDKTLLFDVELVRVLPPK